MAELTADQEARTRFREEFHTNFAVSANAGSGKTTAIAERLAHMALSAEGAALLPHLVVVTFTKKAAAQMRQRARATLWQELARRRAQQRATPPQALEQLDRAYFGTIHSFCLQLGRRFGAAYGLNLNPEVVEEDDEQRWQEFLEQDPMEFAAMPAACVDACLRFLPLGEVFRLASKFSLATAKRFLERAPRAEPPAPDERVLAELQALPRRGTGRENLEATQRAAADWVRRFHADRDFLPMLVPLGLAKRVGELVQALTAPLKAWLAAAAAALAAELALRYREYRFERGVQTYTDQVEAALAVLQHPETLDRVRAEGFRVLLDEAQDTDPQQFAVLVEIARPPGATIGDWPGGGAPPRPGHFSMVGDGQQAIYSSRTDVRNFLRHLEAFARRDGGEKLDFQVTFRAPHRAAEFFNAGFPEAFGEGREYNWGVAPRRQLQVAYSPLVAAPTNAPGLVSRLPLAPPAAAGLGVEPRLAEEVRQIARVLRAGGPAIVGARSWSEVCLLAPRNDWLGTARKMLEAEGLQVALQTRRSRNADHPVYAWLSGLLAVLADPENAFEWVGVLREVFAVSDAAIAAACRAGQEFRWDEPERHPAPIAAALRTLAPFVEQADEEGMVLEEFATALVGACALREKARLADPTGGSEAELERLCAQAAQLGQAGGGPREWRNELLRHREEGRPAGQPADDAINLLTSHSAKGLEWPVVIPIGLWREPRDRPETGLRLLAGDEPAAQVYFDGASVPEETAEARKRERWRERARLLYVTFTRAQRHLMLPWHPQFAPVAKGSFADLWGRPDLFDALPDTAAAAGGVLPRSDETPRAGGGAGRASPRGAAQAGAGGGKAQPPLPARLLPHQLAQHPDAVRATRHESTLEEPAFSTPGDDPIDYGRWWHETMEFLPWDGNEAEIGGYLAEALGRARQEGFGERADGEIARLRAGEFFRGIQGTSGRRLTELAVFAPLRPDAWVDGVVDLIVHDQAAQMVRVIDWKTNRPRSGEDAAALLRRLAEDYRPQLQAYGACVAGFFPGCEVRLELYASAVGAALVLRPD